MQNIEDFLQLQIGGDYQPPLHGADVCHFPVEDPDHRLEEAKEGELQLGGTSLEGEAHKSKRPALNLANIPTVIVTGGTSSIPSSPLR